MRVNCFIDSSATKLVLAKQQREATTNAINAEIQRRASLAGNMGQVTGTITNSLQTFRMP